MTGPASLRRLLALVICVGGVASSCAEPHASTSASPHASNPEAKELQPLSITRQGLDEEIQEGAARYLSAPTESVVVHSYAQSARLAFAVFSLVRGQNVEVLFASFEAFGTRWVTANALSVPPQRGSRRLTSLVQIADAGMIATGGLVGSGTTHIQAISPTGQVLDEDRPKSGGAVVVAPLGGQVRVYRGAQLMAAYPAVVDPRSIRATFDNLDIAGASSARKFVELLLNADTDRAGALLDANLDPELFLPPLVQVMADGRATAWPRSAPVPIADFRLALRSGPVRMNLTMTKRRNGWLVASYALIADVYFRGG